MSFTNFCCRSGGSNLNAGTRTGDTTVPGTAADLTYASGTWVQATRVFTVASGDPAADGVAVGDFVSVYPDAATVSPYIAQVTARDATTITMSATVKAGAAPVDGTTNTTLKVGGAWLGPNGAEDFPFDLATLHTLGVIGTGSVRVNMKNDATYSITASIAPSTPTAGVYIEGFSSAYGDDGQATIDGGTSGASYQLLNSTTAWWMVNLIFQNNGATGSASGVGTGFYRRCVFHGIRGLGANAPSGAEECEFYDCNQSNTGNMGGASGGGVYTRCIFHDITGSNSAGVNASGSTGGPILQHCIFDTNQVHVKFNGQGNQLQAIGCDFYNATGDAISLTRAAAFSINLDNCNFCKNGGYGINAAITSGNFTGHIINCGFGTGTEANTSGDTNGMQSVESIDSVSYAANVNPWVDPANGDFRINLAAAQGAGRGSFLQTAASYAGTVAYPDIGAAQHQDAGGSGGMQVHPGMAGGMRG